MSLDQSACDIILRGEIVSCQLTPVGSNYTFVVQVQLGDSTSLGIYKPRDGESPLWDFPSGTLYKREYAAYLLSQHLGWDFIPFTTIRDGPHGIGTVQLFVEHDPKQNYYTLTEANAGPLKTIACFDLVANSWDFSGQPIPKRLLTRLSGLSQEMENPQGLLKEIQETIHPDEMAALGRRVEWILSEGVYPGLPGGYRRRR